MPSANSILVDAGPLIALGTPSDNAMSLFPRLA